MAEPNHDHPGGGTDADPDRVSEGVAVLSELAAAGVEVDGEVQIAELIWVIYGHTSYDGEVLVGEYHDAAEAWEVLRPAPRRKLRARRAGPLICHVGHVDPAAATRSPPVRRRDEPKPPTGRRGRRAAGNGVRPALPAPYVTGSARPGAHRFHYLTDALRRPPCDPLGPAGPAARDHQRGRRMRSASLSDGQRLGGSYHWFRGVHDVLGHARLRVGFDPNGGFAAWRNQDRFHSPLAR
jgi:hypothetical protein